MEAGFGPSNHPPYFPGENSPFNFGGANGKLPQLAEDWNQVLLEQSSPHHNSGFFSGLNLTFSGGIKRCTGVLYIVTVNTSITLCIL